MPYATATDGTRLYYEITGTGPTVVFLHEFAGDHRSWAPQIDRLSSRYRCVTPAARGYPPSDVPADPAAYSQRTAVTDALAVIDELDADRPHLVGLSMGGFCALHLLLTRPGGFRSAVVAGAGYGADPQRRPLFTAEAEAAATAFRENGPEAAERYASGPTRVQFRDKDPNGWREFADALGRHDFTGAANTMDGVQARRPSLYDLREDLATIETPVLIVTGDEDDGCLEPNLMLKRTVPSAGWAVLPRTGHTVNLEEPTAFTMLVSDFLHRVDTDAWTRRNPTSTGRGLVGM